MLNFSSLGNVTVKLGIATSAKVYKYNVKTMRYFHHARLVSINLGRFTKGYQDCFLRETFNTRGSTAVAAPRTSKWKTKSSTPTLPYIV